MAEGRRRWTEGTIGHGACSQLAIVEVKGCFKTKKREKGDRKKREKKGSKKNKVSIHKEM